MSEITDQEIRDTIFEVLKKQVTEDQIAKKQRREKMGLITTGDLPKKNSFCTKDVLDETEKRLSEGRDIKGLVQRVFDQFYSERYFDLGAYRGDPDPLKLSLTDKGQKKLDSLSS